MLNAVEESNSDRARISQPRSAERTMERFRAHKRENVGENGPYRQPGDRSYFSRTDTGPLVVSRSRSSEAKIGYRVGTGREGTDMDPHCDLWKLAC